MFRSGCKYKNVSKPITISSSRRAGSRTPLVRSRLTGVKLELSTPLDLSNDDREQTTVTIPFTCCRTSLGRMYSNAGIRSRSRTLSDLHPTHPNNRHALSASDPPHATSNALSSLSSMGVFVGHHAHRSEDGILSIEATTPSPSVQTNKVSGSRMATTTTPTGLAPPSSFHAPSKTSTTTPGFFRMPSHKTSPSASSVATYNTNYNKTPSASSSSLYLSRSALSKLPFQPTPSVSRSSSTSHLNSPGTGQVESSASQRINMKRLMSKPTAISNPDRSQSVAAFVPLPPSDTDDSKSTEDHLAIRSRSLDILRKTKRRSRSVDLSPNDGAPSSHPVPSPDSSLHQMTTESTAQTPTFSAARSSAVMERVRGLTRSPSTPTTARPAVPTLSIHHNKRESYLGASPDRGHSFPGSPLSPASLIALAWIESQKRANPSTPIRDVATNPNAPQSEFVTTTRFNAASPAVFADPNESSSATDLSASPVVVNSPEEGEESDEEDAFTPWAFAQQGTMVPLSRPATRNASHRSTEGGRHGSKLRVAAAVREVSRQLSGAFGRKDRKNEKPCAERFPIGSLSMGPLAPNLETNASPPSPFSAKRVSKAPKSHERPRSLALSHFMGVVKNETLPIGQSSQTHDQPLVADRQGAPSPGPNSLTGDLGLLDRARLSIYNTISFEAGLPERDARQNSTSEMPNWPLLRSRRPTIDENEPGPTFLRQTSSRLGFSPLSPMNSERGSVAIPARSDHPSVPKKRSFASLRTKPSFSALVSLGGTSAEGTGSVGYHSPYVLSSTIAASTASFQNQNEGTANGGRLRGLVKKLSSGTLGRIAAQSDKSRSSPAGVGARGYDSPASRDTRGPVGENVPPVPQIPKDFELIVDADAYFAERARARTEEKLELDDDSVLMGQAGWGPNAAMGSSQMSSRRSSFLGQAPREHMPVDAASLSSSLNSRLRIDTDLDRVASSSKESSAPVPGYRQPPPTQNIYAFPRRPGMHMEHSSSGHSYTAAGYRSSSPSLSSTDLHSGKQSYTAATTSTAVPGSYEEKGSLSSHSHEMASSHLHSIARPIMAPKDLYQHGEDEAAALRRQHSREADGSATFPLRIKRFGFAMPLDRATSSQDHSPVTPPPPTLSPRVCPLPFSHDVSLTRLKLLPLTAPPPRPPRRITRAQSSAALNEPALRPAHMVLQRSLSSPMSPSVPTYLTTRIPKPIPTPPKEPCSAESSPISPQSPTLFGLAPASSAGAPVKRARSNSLKKKAKHLPHLVFPLMSSESASHTAPPSAASEQGSGRGTSHPRAPTKSPSGASSRRKGAVTPKSASSPKSTSHTPSSSAGYTMSPETTGHRSSSGRASRDQSPGQGWATTEDGEVPPMPFTSTAFTFKEISPITGALPFRGRLLTEGEREELWNELLNRSDRVGGTLTLTMEQAEGPALLSDNASFWED